MFINNEHKEGGTIVIDSIENCGKYELLIPGLRQRLTELSSLPQYTEGKYEIEGGFYMIQKGTTVPSDTAVFETHEAFIEVQYLVAGQEVLEWNTPSKLDVVRPYDADKDVRLHRGTGMCMTVKPGTFYILFPENAHKACCHQTIPTEYVKVVLKLRIPGQQKKDR